MEPKQVRQDSEQTGNVDRAGFVLVEDGTVLALFGANEAQAAADLAYRLTERDGRHVDVYEVGRGLPPPPPVGERVDPKALGWIDVN